MSILGTGVRGLDREGHTSTRRPQQQSNRFRLTEGERKLPRPIVFWSENEKDAFRRNKVVQTRYYMLLNDIENQKRTTQRTIKYEAHKFRQRSAKFMQERPLTESDSSCVDSEVMSQSSKNKTSQDIEDDSESDMSSDSSEKEDEFWEKMPPKGVLTKSKKPTVKFSVYKQFIPYEESHLKIEHRSMDKERNLRSLSAPHPRPIPSCPMIPKERCKSVLPEVTPNATISRESSYSRRLSTLRPMRSLIGQNMMAFNNEKKTPVDIKMRTPNKLFFDKSQAAYQLRKELQRLARIRKQTVTSSPFTVEQALKEEKEKYLASRAKVTEYLQRMDREKPSEWIGRKWSRSEIEQDS